MTLDEKCEIIEKLDYEGGYEYLIYGHNFAGIDPHFDKLVQEFKDATKALEVFLNIEDCEGEES